MLNLFLDVLVIAVMAGSVIYGYKNGFVKSLMSLVSGIVSVLVAYTFTPMLSAWLNAKYILGAISKGIAETFASAAKTTGEAADEIVYDLTKMFENPQIKTIIERFGADMNAVENAAGEAEIVGFDLINKLAVTVAKPVANTVSTVLAFLVLFLGAVIVLKIVTVIVAAMFKLPVLKSMDKGLGLVSGIICAVFLGWVLSLAIEVALSALVTVAPRIVTENTFNNTIIVKFFSENSFLDLFSKIGL
ncbi:MAG: CvpA family protein [Clostridia bacterium]|nr:CvpA family protein [Clostridia bacterium]